MKKTIIILTILVLLGLLLLIGTAFLSWNSPYYEREGASTTENTPQLPAGTTAESLLESLNGFISGSLSYPSEFIPPMEVCAVNAVTNEEYCTYEQISGLEFTYRVGYELKVPEGKYTVFARLDDSAGDAGDMAGFKAYYSEFVKCGMDIGCSSHAPVEVQVSAGETEKGIDPQDWYAGIESSSFNDESSSPST